MTIKEQLGKLTKRELLQLVEDSFYLFHLSERDIKKVKGNTLRKQAEDMWNRSQEANEKARLAISKSPPDYATYYQKSADNDKYFKKYERLAAQADKLLFGE